MGNDICPRCQRARTGNFRYCRFCAWDFEEVAGGGAGAPLGNRTPRTAPARSARLQSPIIAGLLLLVIAAVGLAALALTRLQTPYAASVGGAPRISPATSQAPAVSLGPLVSPRLPSTASPKPTPATTPSPKPSPKPTPKPTPKPVPVGPTIAQTRAAYQAVRSVWQPRLAAVDLAGSGDVSVVVAEYSQLLHVYVGYRAALGRIAWAAAVRADGRELLAATDQVISDLRVVVRSVSYVDFLSASTPLLVDVTHETDLRRVVERDLGIK